MPLFAYVCPSCNHCFETLVRDEADVPETCPSCGADDPRRQLSRFATIEKQDAGPPCESGQCSGSSCPYAQ